jgi:hypothetical protein
MVEDVIADLRKMRISGWKEKARNRDQWRRIIEEAKAQPGLWRRGELTTLIIILKIVRTEIQVKYGCHVSQVKILTGLVKERLKTHKQSQHVSPATH